MDKEDSRCSHSIDLYELCADAMTLLMEAKDSDFTKEQMLHNLRQHIIKIQHMIRECQTIDK